MILGFLGGCSADIGPGGFQCSAEKPCRSGLICDGTTCITPVNNSNQGTDGEDPGACNVEGGDRCSEGFTCAERDSGFICVPLGPDPTCSDRETNQDETDIDCGGMTCDARCGNGLQCQSGDDCLSRICLDGLCNPASCDDGVFNGDETSIDCGGICAACDDGLPCRVDSDCESRLCDDSVCAAGSCDDGVENGDESDVDCGGETCEACPDGSICASETDCASGICIAEECTPAACDDGVRNGAETDVDCGGPCDACGDGLACEQPSDCASLVCSMLACAPAACGDGVRNGDEACDDGNMVQGDDCLNDCTIPRCGDGQIRVGIELCDDANDVEDDQCTNACRRATCGDGIKRNDLVPGIEGFEMCDDGNLADDDACLTTCLSASCGDGIRRTDWRPGQSEDVDGDGRLDLTDEDVNLNGVLDENEDLDGDGHLDVAEDLDGDGILDGFEECDDGNDDQGDRCLSNCSFNKCGDGFIRNETEDCDDGADNGDDKACTSSCALNRCGDGLTLVGVEDCDDGNSNNFDDCTNECRIAGCGDGLLLVDVEACDLGLEDASSEDANGNGILDEGEDANGNGQLDTEETDTDGCTNLCLENVCGDGVVWQGVEACDDGNNIDTDGCTNACELAVCGDGLVHAGVEECDSSSIQTGECEADCRFPRCGDNIVNVLAGERCDDGNDDDTDDCLPVICIEASCGDGKLHATNEECDDGAGNGDTKRCTSACRVATCGDGFIQEGIEACDDGSNNGKTKGCREDCTVAFCGDSHVHAGVEACDDGNDINDDDCTNECRLPGCGDGVLQEGEACDLGLNNSNEGECTLACEFNRCGDGFRWLDVEECDDGQANSDEGTCREDCVLARCGDLVVRTDIAAPDTPEFEECDGPRDINDNVDVDGCTNACKFNICGDNVRHVGVEECDDGNRSDDDGCDNNCTISGCGNGVPNPGEECDDGNDIDGDGCDSNCKWTQCGNDKKVPVFVPVAYNGASLNSAPPPFNPGDPPILEDCDDGNLDSGDGCDANCTITACGNGITVSNYNPPGSNELITEACDDGNDTNGDGCDNNCQFSACGNGALATVQDPLYGPNEECDDGNAVDNDECDSNCTIPACGNNILNTGEECDDGNLENGDGCDSNCTVTSCGNGVVSAGEECDDGPDNNEVGPCLLDCTRPDNCSPNCPDITYADIPGGTFTMGSSEQGGIRLEAPAHSVTVPDFSMSISEVTVEQYMQCANSTCFDEDGNEEPCCALPSENQCQCNFLYYAERECETSSDCPCGRPCDSLAGHCLNAGERADHPMNCVSWTNAAVFAEWASARLPSEAEWEYAARSGDDREYPWGDREPTCDGLAHFYDENNPTFSINRKPGCGTETSAPVCSYPAGNTVHGLCDMAGNVFEWTADDLMDYDEDINNSQTDEPDPGEDVNDNGVIDLLVPTDGSPYVKNEDENFNGILDPGEDLNGNGIIDPLYTLEDYLLDPLPIELLFLKKVYRGGGYSLRTEHLRSRARYKGSSTYTVHYLGFRVVRQE